MADKDGMERKVYLLPADLVDRIKAYQADCGLPSEVEAARRLLSEALQARDGIDDIMKQVRAQFHNDRDLRNLAREVLSPHILINRIEIGDNELRFIMRNLDSGKITRKGRMEVGQANEEGYVHRWNEWPQKHADTTQGPTNESWIPTKSWNPTSDDDLDAPIPF